MEGDPSWTERRMSLCFDVIEDGVPSGSVSVFQRSASVPGVEERSDVAQTDSWL